MENYENLSRTFSDGIESLNKCLTSFFSSKKDYTFSTPKKTSKIKYDLVGCIAKNKLIFVCDSLGEFDSDLLRLIIIYYGKIKQKYGYESVIWSKKEWMSRDTELIKKNNKVIFIGKQPKHIKIDVQFDQYGVKYGLYEGCCYIWADPIKAYNKLFEGFIDAAEDVLGREAGVAAYECSKPKILYFPPFNSFNIDRIRSIQYAFGLKIFIRDNLDEFLKGRYTENKFKFKICK